MPYTTWKGSMAQPPLVLVYHGPENFLPPFGGGDRHLLSIQCNRLFQKLHDASCKVLATTNVVVQNWFNWFTCLAAEVWLWRGKGWCLSLAKKTPTSGPQAQRNKRTKNIFTYGIEDAIKVHVLIMFAHAWSIGITEYWLRRLSESSALSSIPTLLQFSGRLRICPYCRLHHASWLEPMFKSKWTAFSRWDQKKPQKTTEESNMGRQMSYVTLVDMVETMQLQLVGLCWI